MIVMSLYATNAVLYAWLESPWLGAVWLIAGTAAVMKWGEA